MMTSSLTRNDKDNFLRFLYFGKVDDPVSTAIDKAYLDFNRTLHGLQTLDHAPEVVRDAKRMLHKEILCLTQLTVTEQSFFDEWHKQCCDQIKCCFKDYKIQEKRQMHYGQAQKWINMALKYLYILEEGRFSGNYGFYHIPIDNVILDRLKDHNPPKFTATSWSRIDNYSEYLGFQSWFREAFKGIPMDNEFKLWLYETLD